MLRTTTSENCLLWTKRIWLSRNWIIGGSSSIFPQLGGTPISTLLVHIERTNLPFLFNLIFQCRMSPWKCSPLIMLMKLPHFIIFHFHSILTDISYMYTISNEFRLSFYVRLTFVVVKWQVQSTNQLFIHSLIQRRPFHTPCHHVHQPVTHLNQKTNDNASHSFYMSFIVRKTNE